ncbi:hypothetical protein TCDM_09685 [Trypanosoma cruzi Dm28c]|uniref:Uncharacterized protein n=1 Tax=Trypanosoma cruzi Dm28c TaxID=1416333 RepID=V5D5A2_TRYCR|nr:hypothetical protein TCDM_09685 [Trypanosoma cruzi Dm28c]
MHLHAETLQCRMHGSTEICFLRVPRIRRVGKRVQTPRRGLIPRHRRQRFSPPNNTLNIPHIQCGISDGATVHLAFGWASWMLPRQRPLEYRSDVQCLTETPNVQSMWRYSLMFGAERFFCSNRQPNRRHSLIPSLALRSVRLQRPPVPIVILQFHAINVFAVVVLPRSHRGIRRAHHHAHRQHSSPRCGLPCVGR